jgi:glycosyltransferase involved in cell wall biosynthesis
VSEKKKFLLIVGNIDTFWTHRIGLARAIIKDGWELHLAASHATQDARLKDEGIIPHDLPAYTSSLNPLKQVQVLRDILSAMKAVQPDMMHAITIRYSFWSGLARKFLRSDTPSVYTIAGLGSLFLSDAPSVRCVRTALVPTLKFVFGGGGHKVIFQNNDDAKRLIKLGCVQKENAALIRGSGVDMNEFSYAAEPDVGVPSVLFCARLLKAKGIGEFVHAARILKSKGIEARFLVAGDVAPGNHDSITQEEIKDWQEEGSIEWLGQRGDIPALMRACSVVTLPSYYGEGVPKVLLEAAATGRPIVTTTMPGCKDVVEDGVSGFLVEPRDAWGLAEALEKLLMDKNLRTRMGEAGRKRAEEMFSLEKVNAKTLAVYRSLMS